MGYRARPFREALELQALVLTAARNDTTPPGPLAQLARAWDVLEERKRILRMKPLPKAVDVSPKPKPKPSPFAFVEDGGDHKGDLAGAVKPKVEPAPAAPEAPGPPPPATGLRPMPRKDPRKVAGARKAAERMREHWRQVREQRAAQAKAAQPPPEPQNPKVQFAGPEDPGPPPTTDNEPGPGEQGDKESTSRHGTVPAGDGGGGGGGMEENERPAL